MAADQDEMKSGAQSASQQTWDEREGGGGGGWMVRGDEGGEENDLVYADSQLFRSGCMLFARSTVSWIEWGGVHRPIHSLANEFVLINHASSSCITSSECSRDTPPPSSTERGYNACSADIQAPANTGIGNPLRWRAFQWPTSPVSGRAACSSRPTHGLPVLSHFLSLLPLSLEVDVCDSLVFRWKTR